MKMLNPFLFSRGTNALVRCATAAVLCIESTFPADPPLLAAEPYPASGLTGFGVVGDSCLQGTLQAAVPGSRQPCARPHALAEPHQGTPPVGAAEVLEQRLSVVIYGYT